MKICGKIVLKVMLIMALMLCTCAVAEEYAEAEPSYAVATDETSFTINSDGVITAYNGTDTDVVIPAVINGIKVTSISEVFRNNANLTSIVIPESVTKINDYAFKNCTSLVRVTIPEGVTEIGWYAFSCCRSLEEVTIPKSVTLINYYAFEYCEMLKKVYASDLESWLGITFRTAESNPLYHADDLYFNGVLVEDIVIPDNVTEIGNHRFYSCYSLKSVTIPDSVTKIGTNAFRGCDGLTSITIPDSVTSIGDYAFYHCDNLESVRISENVTTLGESVFSYCKKLKEVTIPDSVIFIEDQAFYYDESLERVTIGEGVTQIGDHAFWRCANLKSLIIPDGVTKIGNNAFADGYSIESLVVPDSLTDVGVYAFSNLIKLNKLYLLGDSMPAVDLLSYFGSSWITPNKVTIYCYEFSEADFWAEQNGYTRVYVGRGVPESLAFTAAAGMDLYPVETLNLRIQTFPKTPSNYDIAWQSSDTQVASVANGIVTAHSVGTTIITASCGGKSITASVQVLPETTPKQLSIPEEARLDISNTLTIKAATYPKDASEYEFVWHSSAPEVASVENGVVTPHAAGTTTITVSCGSKSASMSVTVYVPVQSFTLSDDEIWVISRQTAQLTILNILPENATGYSFTRSSSDTSIVTVNGDTLTAKVPGDAVVTVTSDNNISRECIVHVCYPVTAIEFAMESYGLTAGHTAQLIANVSMGTQSAVNKLVTFSSSDPFVVTVDAAGVITAIEPGTATITATAQSGVTATCTVTVTPEKRLVLPNSLTRIEDEAFRGCSFDAVILSNNTVNIGSLAFADCSNLKRITIPASVTAISDDAFEGCTNLVIICKSESFAEEYAARNSIRYICE